MWDLEGIISVSMKKRIKRQEGIKNEEKYITR